MLLGLLFSLKTQTLQLLLAQFYYLLFGSMVL